MDGSLKPGTSTKKLLGVIASSILLVMILGLTSIYGVHVLLTTFSESENKVLKATREAEWAVIESIIKTNTLKAKNLGGDIKRKIKREVAKTYTDMEQLRTDLENPRDEAPLYGILQEAISSRQLNNLNTKDTVVFIADKSEILTHNFRDTYGSPLGERVTWDQMISRNSNPNLAAHAVASILEQEGALVYWDSTRRSLSPNGSDIAERGNLDELKAQYLSKGLIALDSYQFLVPTYIEDTGDITGIQDVSPTGIHQQSNKMYVIVTFNIYEVIQETTDGVLFRNIRYQSTELASLASSGLIYAYAAIVILFVFLLLILWALANQYNNAVKLGLFLDAEQARLARLSELEEKEQLCTLREAKRGTVQK